MGEKRWAKVVKNLDKQSDKIVTFIHEFLTTLKSGPWRLIDITWNLPNATVEMWDNMEAMGISFPELSRLRNEQRQLRESWRIFYEQLKEKKGKELEEYKNKVKELVGGANQNAGQAGTGILHPGSDNQNVGEQGLVRQDS